MKARKAVERLRLFLRDPANLPGQPRTARLVETHASLVVVAPQRVYKIKKPVDLGFLDFSTLEKRRHFCQREVELNHRLCPGVHLRVVPITSHRGQLAFAGAGRTVEYAIEMRRLTASGLLPARLARGHSVKRDLARLVAVLQKFYAGQTSAAEIRRWGAVPMLRRSTNENFRQCQPHVGCTLDGALLAALKAYTNRFYRVHPGLFAARVRGGHILDAHGDLRLEHVHVNPQRVAVFDCIEFNDRLRYIDVASEAAFLAMDLDFHGYPGLAAGFARELSGSLDDPGMLRLLDFYKCYRAVVRGKVESIRLVELPPQHPERRAVEARARRYFQLALRYAVAGSQPTVLAIMGRAATGKSTLAAELARELGWEAVSADRLRKNLAGIAPFQRGSSTERAKLYSRRMSDRTYRELSSEAAKQVRASGGVVLDATFSSRQRREALRRKVQSLGAVVVFLELRARRSAIRERLVRRERGRGEVSDARLEDLPVLDRMYEPPAKHEASLFVHLESRRTPAATARAALEVLAERGARRADFQSGRTARAPLPP